MRVLFWVLAVGYALSIGGQLFWLATETYPKRSPSSVATGVAVNLALLIWILLVWP